MRNIGFCDFQTLISDNMLQCNYLKYMENFDYRSILVDSGSIVHCTNCVKKQEQLGGNFPMSPSQLPGMVR